MIGPNISKTITKNIIKLYIKLGNFFKKNTFLNPDTVPLKFFILLIPDKKNISNNKIFPINKKIYII